MRNQLGSVAISLVLGCLPLQMMVCEAASAQSIQPKSSLLAENATPKALSYREKRKREADQLREMGFNGRRSRLIPYPEREKLLRQASIIYKEIGDRQGEFQILVNLASLDALRFRHGKAVEKLHLALQMAKLSGDRKSELSILLSGFQTVHLFRRGNFTNVYIYLIIHDPLSLDIIESFYSGLESGNEYSCKIYNNIGYSYLKKKLYHQAIKVYKKGLTECSKLNIAEEIKTEIKYRYLANIGITYKLLGQEIDAQSILDKVLVFYEDIIFNSKRLPTFIGSYDEGGTMCETFTRIVVLKRSDSLLQKLKRSKCGYAEMIGEAYTFFGEYALAINYYGEALNRDSIYYQHKIARMYELLGDNAKASQSYSLALKNLQNLVNNKYDYEQGLGLLINMGNFYTKIGEKEKGKSFYNQANEILKLSTYVIHGGGGIGDISILSDEDDLDKLLSTSSDDRKPESTPQEMQK